MSRAPSVAILAASEHPAGLDVVQDVMALIKALVNAAASRGERDAGRLLERVGAVIRDRLSVD